MKVRENSQILRKLFRNFSSFLVNIDIQEIKRGQQGKSNEKLNLLTFNNGHTDFKRNTL